MSGIIRTQDGVGIDQNNPLPVKTTGADGIQPVERQAVYAETIQTHNAVNVALGGGQSASLWIDTDGFDKVSITVLNDASTAAIVHLYWSNDGINEHGTEQSFISDTSNKKVKMTDTKARYLKVVLVNSDGALAHVMSAWAYLKA